MAKPKGALAKKNQELNEVEMLLKAVIDGVLEKKGNDIVQMDLGKVKNAITSFFVVCHAESGVQVKAIADSVEEEVHKLTGVNPLHREGAENAEWILLDYFEVVVHIFRKEFREHYNLEKLWGDAEIIKIT